MKSGGLIDFRQIGLVGAAAAVIAISSAARGFESSNDELPDEVPKFVLSDQYPADLKTAMEGESHAWRAFDFKTEDGARNYLLSVLSYVIEGNEETFHRAADGTDRPWQVKVDGRTRWYHVPWMHYGAYGREGIHGLTRERDLRLTEILPPEDNPPEKRFQSWAVSFYSPPGGYTIGRVWPGETAIPEPSNAQFGEHTIAAKLLFTTASGEVIPYLEGAPVWQANVHKTPRDCKSNDPADSPKCDREVQAVQLIQLDVAVKDDRAGATGWVFGTFVFNGNRSPSDDGAIVPAKRIVNRQSVWNQLEPVGLMWGNDPGLHSKEDLKETVLTKDKASVYQHLGCLDRLNGPVDNPAASCMACHVLARFPAPRPDNFSMSFPACGGTSRDDQGRLTAVSAAYFRNLSGSQVIDDLQDVRQPEAQKLPEVENLDRIKGLDYSLQLSFGVINFCNFWRHEQYTQDIEEFCDWNIEQAADLEPVIADRSLGMKALLSSETPRQAR